MERVVASLLDSKQRAGEAWVMRFRKTFEEMLRIFMQDMI